MPIVFECPNCNAKMRAPDGSAGKQARCPTCSELVTIGGAAAAPPPPAPEEDEPRSRGVRERPEEPARRGRDEEEAPRSRSRRSRDEDEDDRPSRRRDEDEDDRPSRRRDYEDEDGGRSVRRRQPQEEMGFSIASLVLGIVAFVPCVCWAYGGGLISAICGVLAIVFGVMGQKKGGKGMALAGIICGAIAVALDVLMFIAILILGATILTMGGGR